MCRPGQDRAGSSKLRSAARLVELLGSPSGTEGICQEHRYRGVWNLSRPGSVRTRSRGATGGGGHRRTCGGLVGAGIPEVEARRYAGRIREGGSLISVHCDDRKWAKRAEEILETTGGRDVVKTAEAPKDYHP